MPVYLLLSSDAGLQAELESSLGGLTPKPTLIQAKSWKEVDHFLDSLRDVEALVMDLDEFDPPVEYRYPILLVGDAKGKRVLHPIIPRPLHTENLSFALEDLRNFSQGTQDSISDSHKKLEFISLFIREVTHDLNNQITTLGGNIPLLKELYPEEADVFSDMLHATERSTQLLHLLEGLSPDPLPESETFPFHQLRKDFFHFAKKMYPGHILQEIPEKCENLSLRGDGMLLCTLMLQLLWLYSPNFPDLKISVESIPQFMEVHFVPTSPFTASESLKKGLRAISTSQHPRDIKLRLENKTITSSIPLC